MNPNYNNPFIIEKGEHYIPSLSSLHRVYTQHPNFKPSTKLVYELLFDYWNPDYGYAFPTIRQLERDSGLGGSTIKRQIETLVKLDLVEKQRSRTYGNNVYRVKKPVQTLDELYAKFPEIEVEAKERFRRIDKADKAEKERRKGQEGSLGEHESSELDDVEDGWF
ncbi:helix-turn-helix domain-containing protein [Halobacillus mangrovi]|uniref:Helix-turn-helix domain-containing protein n=1 Tax=Halobacillus mangrovi TaxID=402384 RepID=A0A1W5ZY97_9BACI|nr:helix-turn-helix domain-containing protein [Halobacillus mangrovi]ARI78239.1 hypothetical protein HM131_15880 [Halobacillus mangrovi]